MTERNLTQHTHFIHTTMRITFMWKFNLSEKHTVSECAVQIENKFKKLEVLMRHALNLNIANMTS